MKKILATLLASYALQINGQTTSAPGSTAAPGTTGAVQPPPPPIPPVPPQPPVPPVPPVSTAPVVAATTTAAPTTAAPTTAMPTTATPTTAAPTFNRYCPPAAALQNIGSHNPFLGGVQLQQDAACKTTTGPGSIARDWQGQLNCNTYHCCLCSEINCGGSGFPCENLKISDSGAVGVQNIVAIGANTGFMGALGVWQNGAQVDCAGLESCKRSKIRGQYVGQMQCTGDFACEGADILLEPAEQMNVQCNGMMSCMNANIEIIIGPNTGISTLGTIEMNGQQSAQGLTVTIRNLGYNPVLLENLECMNPTACPNFRIILEGNIMIENCDLQGIQNLNTLPLAVQQCQLNQIGGTNNNFPNLIAPGYNPFNPGFPAPAPLPPAAPAPAPLPGQAPGTPLPPQRPSGPAPAPGQAPAATPALFLPFNANQQLDCTAAMCANKIITISPSNNWKLNCPLPGSCNGLQLTLNVGMDPLNMGMPVERIDSFTFGGASSGINAKITINNVGGGMFGGFGFNQIELNDVRCENFASCNGLTIIADAGIDLMGTNFDCQQPGACAGCTAQQTGMQTQQCIALHNMNNNQNYNPFAGYNPQQFNQNPYTPPQQPQFQPFGYQPVQWQQPW